MNFLILNCQGLGLASTVGELRNLVRSLNPAVVFLSETKMKKKAMERLQWSVGFRFGVSMDCKGRSGGLIRDWAATCV